MIKKAKEYAEELLPVLKPENEEAIKVKIKELIFCLLENEAVELFETRHCKTRSGMGGILRELDQKYRAIVRIANSDLRKTECGVLFLNYNSLNPNGFMEYLESNEETKALVHMK